ncbi:MAG: hypothetical protein ACR2OH_07205 [Microthrixaceae bacterium]
MSLWTPDGERPIRKDAPPQPEAAPPQAPPGEPSLEDLSPEERAQAEAMMAEMAEAQQRIAETPAADVIANHLMGFYELAAIHLSQQPPNFDDGSLAIDALGAALDKVGDQLGDNGKVLNEALGQIRMAFVQLKDQAEGGAPPEG